MVSIPSSEGIWETGKLEIEKTTLSLTSPYTFLYNLWAFSEPEWSLKYIFVLFQQDTKNSFCDSSIYFLNGKNRDALTPS